MRVKLKKEIFSLFSFVFIVCSTLIFLHTEVLYASETDTSPLIQKISKDYTKKFCNAIGFGLSKESAMNFSLGENKQVFKKKKEINNINKELLSQQIAISVVEKCGYPIDLFGEKGVDEFKSYYLSKDKEYSSKK
tara:strand:- start:1879 stop:2283 length:405 start_codon:yes stop_codon:yes gene_type:complete